jgi:hypothetical protein
LPAVRKHHAYAELVDAHLRHVRVHATFAEGVHDAASTILIHGVRVVVAAETVLRTRLEPAQSTYRRAGANSV